MPMIPGVPTLQPISQPLMSPAEAGRPGETVARLGEEFGQLAVGIAGYVRRAQEHVDKLAAENQLNAAYLAMQDDLAKVVNSRDVEGVLNQANDNVAHIMQEWGKSPAARDIELTAQGYLPHMQHHAQVRQIDLMGKENGVHLGELAKGLLNEVIDPATSAAALAKYSEAVDGSVKSKLMEGWQAEEAKNLFRKAEQVTLLDRASTSPNPAENKAGLDDVIQHPEHYPDLTPQERDAYKRKLEEAFRVNTEWMRKMGVEQFLDRELPNFLKMFGRADGSLDLPEALKEIRRREGLPESSPDHINVQQGDAMRGHLEADNRDQIEMAGEKAKRAEKEISDAMAQHKFVQARQLLNKNMPLLQGRMSEELDKAITARAKRTDEDISTAEDASAYLKIKQMDHDDPDAIERASVLSPHLKEPRRKSLIDWAESLRDKTLKGGLSAGDKYLHSQIAPTKNELMPPGPRQQAKSSDAQQALSDWVKEENDKARKGSRKPLTEAEIYQHAKEMAPQYQATAAEKLADIKEQEEGASELEKEIKKEAKSAPKRPANVPPNAVWNPRGNNGKGAWQLPPQ